MKYIILIAAWMLSAGTIFGQKALTGELKEKIKTQNARISTLNCRFKQTKHLAIMEKDIVSTGRFYYQQPDKLSLHYDTPKGDLMTMNGDSFMIITNGKRRIASSKNNSKLKTLQIMLTSCMRGDIDAVIAHTSAKATYTEESKNYIITLVPAGAEQNKNISKIVLTVSKLNMEMISLRIDENKDNYTLYELTDKAINKPIAASVFDIPKN
jgi:outer membrane lipoprotein-sorting protein